MTIERDAPPPEVFKTKFRDFVRFVSTISSTKCYICGHENWDVLTTPEDESVMMAFQNASVARPRDGREVTSFMATYKMTCSNCGTVADFACEKVIAWIENNPESNATEGAKDE